MIDVHLLRYALAAADTGSFSRAAERFGIKQSTLSKHVHYLEHRLGLSLFQRSTRGVVPTEPGRQILQRVRRIVHDIDALADTSRDLSKGAEGRLRLGFSGSLVTGDLAAIVQAYRVAFPKIAFEAREGSRDRLLDQLGRGDLDVAVLAGETRRPDLRSVCLWSDPLGVVVPEGHSAKGREPLYWSDLRGSAFVVTADDPGADIRSLIVSRLSAPGAHPAITTQRVARDNLGSFATGNVVAVATGLESTGAAIGGTVHRVHDAFSATVLEQGVHWNPATDNPAVQRWLELLARRYGRTIPTPPLGR